MQEEEIDHRLLKNFMSSAPETVNLEATVKIKLPYLMDKYQKDPLKFTPEEELSFTKIKVKPLRANLAVKWTPWWNQEPWMRSVLSSKKDQIFSFLQVPANPFKQVYSNSLRFKSKKQSNKA